jgi:large subunit ribosomal protein L16
MKQYPSDLKFRKYHKANFFYKKILEKNSFFPLNGILALQSLSSGKVTFKQIESCRKTIKRGLKKNGNLLIKLFTNIPIYKKSLASRMGKGKGNLKHWVALVKKGQILFEVSGLSKNKLSNVLNKSKTKLPLKAKILGIIY